MSKSTRHSCRKRPIEVEDRIEIMKVEKWYSGFPLVLENWKTWEMRSFSSHGKDREFYQKVMEKWGNFAPVREKFSFCPCFRNYLHLDEKSVSH